ncbi:hypothetical protein F5Y16DRAFT_165471 [Xylariaceae sp. FL0255]|nr:hypothetical protein F5Y16DRAFT_165471 [Xylariaceae sp. FL0255]
MRTLLTRPSKQSGSVDGLVYFAGVVGCIETLEMPISQWRKVWEINAMGCMVNAQALARRMVKQGTRGFIAFVSSISAHPVNFPQPQAADSVSRVALLSLKNCLAAEWAQYGIRIILPGYRDLILKEGDGIAEHRKIWAERNPSGRIGSPSQLMVAVVLLASNGGDIHEQY